MRYSSVANIVIELFSLEAVVVFMVYNDIKQWVPDEKHVKLERWVQVITNSRLIFCGKLNVLLSDVQASRDMIGIGESIETLSLEFCWVTV